MGDLQNWRSDLNLAIVGKLLIVINFLFLWKYGARLVSYAWLPAYLCATASGAVFLEPVYRHVLRKTPPKWLAGMLIGLFLIATVVVHYQVPLTSLNVDRWSVIDSFLTALKADAYPYFARSHMGNLPGPMPGYFLLAYPFHALGWLELLAAIGPAGALWWMARNLTHREQVNSWLLLIATFVPVYWEILTRSNLLTYSLLVLIGLVYWERKLAISSKARYGAAIIAGLLLATRSVYGLAYLLVFGTRLREPQNRRRVVMTGMVALLAFAAVLLPFYLIWPEEFQTMNPFLVQSGFLVPRSFVVGFFVLALALLPLRFSAAYPFLVSGYLLFLVVTIYAVYQIWAFGFTEAFHGSKIDLSYFLFSVPFLVYGWARPRVPFNVVRAK